MSESRDEVRYRERQAALRELDLLADLDALLVTEPVNCRYLCGFSGSSACLLLTPSRSCFFTDGRYAEQSAEEVSAAEVTVVSGTLFEAIRDRLDEGMRVGFESERLTVAGAQRLREANHQVVWRPVAGAVERLRRTKDDAEIADIGKAVRIAEAALAEALSRPLPGRTELEVAGALEEHLRRYGSEGIAFEPIVASGARGALPHGRASRKVIAEGDLVTIDFGAVHFGYHSDLTRTYAVGAPHPRAMRWFEAVDAAIEAALAVIAPGRPCGEIDRAARRVIEEAGFGEYFVHNLGHGIGLEVHEEPRLARGATAVLEEGMVVTIEPGIYVPGEGGIRIEEDVVVTKKGAHLLSSVPRGLDAMNGRHDGNHR